MKKSDTIRLNLVAEAGGVRGACFRSSAGRFKPFEFDVSKPVESNKAAEHETSARRDGNSANKTNSHGFIQVCCPTAM